MALHRPPLSLISLFSLALSWVSLSLPPSTPTAIRPHRHARRRLGVCGPGRMYMCVYVCVCVCMSVGARGSGLRVGGADNLGAAV